MNVMRVLLLSVPYRVKHFNVYRGCFYCTIPIIIHSTYCKVTHNVYCLLLTKISSVFTYFEVSFYILMLEVLMSMPVNNTVFKGVTP